MFSSPSHARVGSTSIQDELIPLGHNWFIHNPNYRSVRVRYEHIPAEHHDLAIAEVAMEKIVRVLVQMRDWRASLVPCLHRSELGGEDTLSRPPRPPLYWGPAHDRDLVRCLQSGETPPP
ncbi:hypothetical protein ONZ51_g13558 [Trametes cubensis]|uniref:Uncharacterized protein n=1 Tax=Trametes cubensis TaxID=1111947 RepID=A0AAD7TE56_9APHY|nr:hypothetical protein ONZ51_g13558 [Trametes cubensis]